MKKRLMNYLFFGGFLEIRLFILQCLIVFELYYFGIKIQFAFSFELNFIRSNFEFCKKIYSFIHCFLNYHFNFNLLLPK